MALAEFRALDRRERVLLASAGGLVLLARILLPVAGLDRTRRVITGTVEAVPTRQPVDDAESLAWAVTTASTLLPGKTSCLEEALAGRALFERHGLDAKVRLGVAGGDSFRAHAWVEHDGSVVVGAHPEMEAFEPLER